jgi:predicted acetyltransferase
MTDIVIRKVNALEERVSVVHGLGGYAFEATPPLPDRDEWADWLRKAPDITVLAMYMGERPRVMTCSTPMTQNVRGMLYRMAAIWGVASYPSTRRNGYVRRLMGELLAVLREDETPITCLYPFRSSFYERMGYVTFPQPRVACFSPRVLAPLLRLELDGEIELTSLTEGYDTYRTYLQQHQMRVHGFAIGPDRGAEDEANRKWWLAVARVDGEPVGVMLYKITGGGGDDETGRVFEVSRFYVHTVQGRYLMLDWIARHVDQVESVRLPVPPGELPETWVPDMATMKFERFWPPMGRVLDIAKIGGMQVGVGQFTARIADDLCPWNSGTWTFAAHDGLLTVTAAEESAAECDLTISALSALVFGNHDPAMFAFRGWGDPSEAVQAAMRALFPPLLPFLHEHF